MEKHSSLVFKSLIKSLLITSLVAGLFVSAAFIASVDNDKNIYEVNVKIIAKSKNMTVVGTNYVHKITELTYDRSGWNTKNPLRDIYIRGHKEDLMKIGKVVVSIGYEHFEYNNRELFAKWGKKQSKELSLLVSPAEIFNKRSRFPRFTPLINWAGDLNFVRTYIMHYFHFFLIGFLILVAFFVHEKDFFTKTENIRNKLSFLFIDTEGSSKKYPKFVIFTGLAIFLILIIFLQLKKNYYFSTDDNFSQSLPVLIFGCRSIFNEGIFPLYNPFQMCGAPTISIGIHAFLYPLIEFSYFIARFFLNNEAATLEVLALIHITITYFAFIKLMKMLKVKPFIGVISALVFVFNGFNMRMGNSEFYMLSYAMLLPILFIRALKIFKKDLSMKWAVITGILVSIGAYSGFIQMWVYLVILFYVILVALIILNKKGIINLYYVIQSGLIGGFLSMPMIVMMRNETKNLVRTGGDAGFHMGDKILSFFFQPLLSVLNIGDRAYDSVNHTNIIIALLLGVSTLLFLVHILFMRKDKNKLISAVSSNIFLIMFFICFLLALGHIGVLWPLSSLIPPFDNFRNPFRFILFMNFFMTIAGAIILDRIAFRINKPFWRKTVQTFILSSVVAFLFFHVWACGNFSHYPFQDSPYPPLPEKLKAIVSIEGKENPHRIYTSAQFGSPNKGYAHSMHHNIASYYGVPTILGYETLLNTPMITQEYLYEYAVKYIIYYADLNKGRRTPMPFVLDDLIPRYKSEDIMLLEMKKTTPMVFVKGNKSIAFPIKLTAYGANIDLSSNNDNKDVVIAFQYRKGLSVSAEGVKVPFTLDRFQRIVLKTPPSTKNIKLKYTPPLKGLKLAFFLPLAMILLLLIKVAVTRLKWRSK